MIITLHINGKEESVECLPGEMLTEVLRRAGYLEVKKGCDTGNWGSALSFLRGSLFFPVSSYLAIRADGKEVTTIQGVAAKQKNSHSS